MISIREFASSVGLKPPISGRALVEKFGVSSFRAAIAASKMSNLHRRTGGKFGRLGPSTGVVALSADGSWQQPFQNGSIHMANLDTDPNAFTKVSAEVSLAAIKCFGTQDKDGEDSTYAVISVVSVDPNFAHTDQLAFTVRTQIQDNVHAKDVLFKGSTLGIASAFPGSGISIHVAIWDHESGNADEIADKIHQILDDAANKGASALAGAMAAGDPTIAGGTIGDITDFEIAGIRPFEVFTVKLASILANAVSDDLVGEHTFLIPAQTIIDLADPTKFAASLRQSPDLDSDIFFNWPPRPQDEFLFSDGNGSYKIYLKVKGVKTTVPTNDPGIPLQPHIP